jgi:hypothetical protein
MLIALLLLHSWGAVPSEVIAKHLEQLASDDFDEREAAYRALAADPRAEPTVQRHREDADPEIRQRVGKLLAHYAQARAERAIRRGTLLVAAGHVDLLPDLMRNFQPHDPKHRLHGSLCVALSTLVMRDKAMFDHRNIHGYDFIYDDERRLGPRTILRRPPLYGYRTRKPDEVLNKSHTGSCVICEAEVQYSAEEGVSGGLLLADGLRPTKKIERMERISNVVAIINGDIQVPNITGSLVICDGVMQGDQGHTLAIARKGIRWKYGPRTVDVATGEPERYLFMECCSIHVPAPGKRSFGLIRFFEVADVGLTLDACKVTKVSGPLAKAGVQPGDVFTHVDGVAVKDAEALRKALRRRYAILGYGAFTLTREGRPLTVVAELGE